ncbi:helix-turn-helix transcriptional regulator [Rhodobacterales bacterium]|nr:helix-turn-helix transcriptional regulator [Rhodobacterales bacterium]
MRRFSYGCPVELAVSILNGKWKTVILARLKEEPCRYNELKAKIPNISDKVLTQRLKNLEDLGLVAMRPADDTGTTLVYGLTSEGERLRPLLEALYNWASTRRRHSA